MVRLRKVILVLLFLVTSPSFAYKYIGYKWYDSDIPVSYYINEFGTPDCEDEFIAIRNGFQTWEDVPTSCIAFKYLGTTSNRNYGEKDGKNICGWIEEDWPEEWEGAIAVCTIFSLGDRILDADIVFNGEHFLWSTTEESGRYDVQNIATHEIGHFLGLDDLYGAEDAEKTMYGEASPGEIKKRDLHQDDIDGVTFIYPCCSIAVTDPGYDDIGAILTNMGHKFTQIQDSQLADYNFIKQFESIFINCSEDCYDNAPIATQSLRDFVNNGGTLYTSDFAYIYVKTSFPGYITFPENPHIGRTQKITANIVDSGLAKYMGKDAIQIDYNLGGWVPVEDVSPNTDVYIRGSFQISSTETWQNKPLLVGFDYGKGRVYYTTFHNEAQVTEDVQKILEYLVFRIELDDEIKKNKEILKNAGFEIVEEIIGGINKGEEKNYTFGVSGCKTLGIVLNWGGSTLKISVYKPDGTLYGEWKSSTPPIYITIPNAQVGTWRYKITAIDVDFNNYPFVITIGQKTGTPEPFGKDSIYNYPNPFNPDKEITNIRFSVEKESDVTIEIFDVSGDLVWKKELRASPGVTLVPWDGKNEEGRTVANGVYIYRVTADGESVVKKIAVLR